MSKEERRAVNVLRKGMVWGNLTPWERLLRKTLEEKSSPEERIETLTAMLAPDLVWGQINWSKPEEEANACTVIATLEGLFEENVVAFREHLRKRVWPTLPSDGVVEPELFILEKILRGWAQKTWGGKQLFKDAFDLESPTLQPDADECWKFIRELFQKQGAFFTSLASPMEPSKDPILKGTSDLLHDHLKRGMVSLAEMNRRIAEKQCPLRIVVTLLKGRLRLEDGLRRAKQETILLQPLDLSSWSEEAFSIAQAHMKKMQATENLARRLKHLIQPCDETGDFNPKPVLPPRATVDVILQDASTAVVKIVFARSSNPKDNEYLRICQEVVKYRNELVDHEPQAAVLIEITAEGPNNFKFNEEEHK